MAKMDGDPSSSILSSAYFQPRIVDAYLKSTLDSPTFPSKAIQSLSSLLSFTKKDLVEESVAIQKEEEVFDEEEEAEGDEDEMIILRLYHAFTTIDESLSHEQKITLREAIKALSSMITLASSSSSTTTSSSDKKVDSSLLKNRCLLGYCKILKKDWLEAVVDLDLVRGQLHSKAKTGWTDETRNIYIDALNGLQLASLLLGKRKEASRFARWKESALLSG